MENILNIIKSLMSAVKSVLKSLNPLYIIGACIVIMIFVYLHFFSGDKYKKENDKLKADIEDIKKDRNAIKYSLDSMSTKYVVLEKNTAARVAELEAIDSRITQIESNLSKSNTQLSQIKNSVNTINSQMLKIQQNPVKRTGDSLLSSLGEKINK